MLPHLEVEKLLCDRKAFIPTRAPLEDHATVLMRYDNGARGHLWVSSVDAGNMGSQRYRFSGSNASVEWSDSHSDQPIYDVQGEPNRILHHGMPPGAGEPRYRPHGRAPHGKHRRQLANIYPGIAAGTEGVRWLETRVRSADAGSAWVHLSNPIRKRA